MFTWKQLCHIQYLVTVEGNIVAGFFTRTSARLYADSLTLSIVKILSSDGTIEILED